MKLTPLQRCEVARRYNWSRHDQAQWISEEAVASLEKAINDVLSSDPVGTVRRDAQTGSVAVRVNIPLHEPSWLYIDEAGQLHRTQYDDCDAALRIAGFWDVIYQPSEG